MDEINELISADTQATILQVLTVLTLLMPAIERLVNKTTNKVDDKILRVVQIALSIVPRVRLGKGKP